MGCALLAWSGLLACSASGQARGGAEPRGRATPLDDSEVCTVTREPLVLADGTEAYIEPQSLLEVSGRLLVAGLPSYTWEVGTAPNAIRLTHDAHAAAWLDADAPEMVPAPPTDSSVAFGTVRAVALGDGRWGALFSDEDPDSLADHRETVLRVWYAEFDGERWTALEPVPRPTRGALYVNASSRLVRVGERLQWAAVHQPVTGPSTLLFYQRERGLWSVEPMPGDGVDNDVELAFDERQGLLLAVFGVDTDLVQQKSLRLYRRGGGWNLVQRIAVPPPGAEVSSTIAADASGVSVGWTEVSGGASRAYARVDVTREEAGRRLTLDDNAAQLEAVAGLAGGHVWIVDHANDLTGTRELRLLRTDSPEGLEPLASFPNPYTGYFAALAIGARELVVVGPEFNPDPARPVVRSLLLRLSTRCH